MGCRLEGLEVYFTRKDKKHNLGWTQEHSTTDNPSFNHARYLPPAISRDSLVVGGSSHNNVDPPPPPPAEYPKFKPGFAGGQGCSRVSDRKRAGIRRQQCAVSRVANYGASPSLCLLRRAVPLLEANRVDPGVFRLDMGSAAHGGDDAMTHSFEPRSALTGAFSGQCC